MEQPFDLAVSASTPTPRGRAVLCVWAAVPGAVAAPFVFWQTFWGGVLFCALWLFFCAVCVPLHLSTVRGSISLGEVRLSRGILFKSSRRVPTRFVAGVCRIRTPLLALAHSSLLVVYTSGCMLILPPVSDRDADPLIHALEGGGL